MFVRVYVDTCVYACVSVCGRGGVRVWVHVCVLVLERVRVWVWVWLPASVGAFVCVGSCVCT